MEESWKPTCLVVGAGNISLQGLLGSLFALEKKGLLEDIVAYSSSGNGCFFSVLLCLGLSVEKIGHYLSKKKQNLFYDSQSYHYFSEIEDKPEGTDQFLELKFFFTEIFQAKLSIVPTFNQLYLTTGKKLYLTTYNATKDEVLYLSRDTHPDMNLLTAIRLTTGVHHITCDVGYDGDLYIDGGSSNPLPISCFRHKKILALRSCWNRSLDKLYPKTEYGYSCLLLHVASERLVNTAFRMCTNKSLVLNICLGSDEYMHLQNLQYLEKNEEVLLEGYQQTVSGLKQLNKASSNVFYDKRKQGLTL